MSQQHCPNENQAINNANHTNDQQALAEELGSDTAYKLEQIKFLEMFDDNDLKALEKFKKQYESKEDQFKLFLEMQNFDQRNPLHMICKNGNSGQFNLLKPFLEKNKSLYNKLLQQKDENSDTPLNLAFSHGVQEKDKITQQFKFSKSICSEQLVGPLEYFKDSFVLSEDKLQRMSAYDRDAILKNYEKLNHSTKESLDYIFFLERRFDIIGPMIQFYFDSKQENEIKPNIQHGRNNPLHWAIYYGDLASGRFFYNKYPNALFMKNEDGVYPLEIILKKSYENISLAQIIYKLLKDILTKYDLSLTIQEERDLKNKQRGEGKGIPSNQPGQKKESDHRQRLGVEALRVLMKLRKVLAPKYKDESISKKVQDFLQTKLTESYKKFDLKSFKKVDNFKQLHSHFKKKIVQFHRNEHENIEKKILNAQKEFQSILDKKVKKEQRRNELNNRKMEKTTTLEQQKGRGQGMLGTENLYVNLTNRKQLKSRKESLNFNEKLGQQYATVNELGNTEQGLPENQSEQDSGRDSIHNSSNSSLQSDLSSSQKNDQKENNKEMPIQIKKQPTAIVEQKLKALQIVANIQRNMLEAQDSDDESEDPSVNSFFSDEGNFEEENYDDDNNDLAQLHPEQKNLLANLFINLGDDIKRKKEEEQKQKKEKKKITRKQKKFVMQANKFLQIRQQVYEILGKTNELSSVQKLKKDQPEPNTNLPLKNQPQLNQFFYEQPKNIANNDSDLTNAGAQQEQLHHGQTKNELDVYDDRKQIQNEEILFMHKLLVLAIHVEDLTLVMMLVELFSLNPFIKCMSRDVTPLQYACIKGRTSIVRYFIENNSYKYIHGTNLNIKEKIKEKTGILENTALHYAVVNENMDIYKILRDKLEQIEQSNEVVDKEYLHLFNYQGFDPLEMSKQGAFVRLRRKQLEQFEVEALQQTSEVFFQDSFSTHNVELIDEGYQYCIQGISNQADPKKSIVYQQLLNIKKTWKTKYHKSNEKIQIKVLKSFDQTIPKGIITQLQNKIKKNQDQKDGEQLYVYNYLIHIPETVLSRIADYLDLDIYHKGNKCIEPYTTQERKKFTPFKDYHIHSLILFILNTEFNLKFYIKSQIITKLIPLHEFRTRKMIRKAWDKEKYQIFTDSYKFSASSKDLRPINSIAYYYGCDYAFYMNFLINMTMNLFILTFLGLVIILVNWYIEREYQYDNRFSPFYGIAVALWICYILKKTYRSQNELSKVWNTTRFEEHQITRLDYKGQYGIDKVSQDIYQKDTRGIFMRRIVFELLILFCGVFIVIGIFTGITFFNEWADERPHNYSFLGLNRVNSITILKLISGIVNGVAITLSTILFKTFANTICNQENHRYQSNFDNSLTLKMFVFQFFVNYTNLFYYAYVKYDIDTLSKIYGSLLISKNLTFLILFDIIPNLIFLWKKRNFIKKWRVERKEIKKKWCANKNIKLLTKNDKKDDFNTRDQFTLAENFQIKKKNLKGYKAEFLKLNESEMKEAETEEREKYKQNQFVEKLVDLEQKLILQDQIELTLLMPQPLNLSDLWMYVIIQFGFIAFFSITQPIVNFWSLIANSLHIFYTYYAFVTHYQRKRCLERESIGIWNVILKFMGIFAIVNNFGILHFTSKGVERLLGNQNVSDEHQLLIIVTTEHILLVFVFLVLAFTQDIPFWVKRVTKKEELRKRINEDRKKTDELKDFLKKHEVKRRMKYKQQKLRFSSIMNRKGQEDESFCNSGRISKDEGNSIRISKLGPN